MISSKLLRGTVEQLRGFVWVQCPTLIILNSIQRQPISPLIFRKHSLQLGKNTVAASVKVV